MASNRPVKVVKKESRRTAVKGDSSLTKSANQLRREMVETVANWIAETREELAAQSRLCQQFRKTTMDDVITESVTKVS